MHEEMSTDELDDLADAAERVCVLEKENERLRVALEKIVDSKNWGSDGGWVGDSYPNDIARKALETAAT